MATPASPQFIQNRATAFGLDPKAVISVGKQEGLGGGIGDNGTSFGPFQLHYGGEYPSFAPRGAAASQAWAWSPAGINYALGQMAHSARGLTGAKAVKAIVTGFERPANASKEIAGALKAYGVGGNLAASNGTPSVSPASTQIGAQPKIGSAAALSNFLFKDATNLLGGGYGLGPGGLFNALSTPSVAAAPTKVAKATPTAVGNVPKVAGELALPANFKATHDTGGLAGFPAVDNFAHAGTSVLAPVSGRMIYVHTIPWNQNERVGGVTAYLQGDNGKTYFLTHMAGNVPSGRVAAGQAIGKVAAVPNGWWPSHIHEGVYNGIYNPPGA